MRCEQAMYTMFQIATFDDWADISRDFFVCKDEGSDPNEAMPDG